jgi:formylglycine-generating enzyme required for sulfatase activity
MVTLTTNPAGASVSVLRVAPLETLSSREATTVGLTPLSDRPFLAGEYLVRLRRDGFEPVDALLAVQAETPARLEISLVASAQDTTGMVLVTAGRSATAGETPAFLIDRHEVSNARFARFVEAGGYRTQSLWDAPIRIGGRTVSWDDAMHVFVDRSGTPAPRQWSAGKFAEGTADHPVVGVSWYEAAAYAKWAGKQLPTAPQWWRAALGDDDRVFPWGRDVTTAERRANFGLVGPQRVGSNAAGLSPFGCYDMAGNVREWLQDAGAGRKMVVGGSWQDPTYMFEPSHTEFFDPDFANEGIGFRLARAAR